MIKRGLISAFPFAWGLMAMFTLGPKGFAQPSGGSVPHRTPSRTAIGHYTRAASESLDRRGISVHYILVNDLSKSPFSAHGDHDWYSRYSLDLSTDVDGQKTMHWAGASFHLDLKRHANVTGQMYSDVAQGYSNIDADSQMYLYEVWLLQSFGRNRLEIQVGQIDANSKFDAVATAADFLNSSMGYSPTVMALPTYPEPRPGIDIVANLPGSCRIAAGQFETHAGKMALAEAGKKWTLGSRSAAGNVELGYWNLRQSLQTRGGEEVSGTDGYYAVLEQSIWQSEKSRDSRSGEKLAAFLQLGTGDPRENSFSSHLGFGLVFHSPLPSRRSDSMGIAATRVQASADPDDHIAAKREFVSEEYYRAALTKHIALIADAQYFVNPGAGAPSPPFLVLTPRLIFTF